MGERASGRSVPRMEDPRILSGRGRYVDDVKLPGLLHAAFVRSPFPHAELGAVDVSGALATPGVVAAFTAADLAEVVAPMRLDVASSPFSGTGGYLSPTFGPLTGDRLRFVGDPVAIVVGESRYHAEDGCDAVVVDAEPLPPVVDPSTAADPGTALVFPELGSNVIHTNQASYGDVEAAFAGAHAVVRETFHQHRQGNVPMEGRAGIASYDRRSGRLTYHAAHQNPHSLRMQLANLLGLGLGDVDVLCGDIGGSFGQKAYASREEVALAATSKLLGRPVKWIEDRQENLLAAGQAREEVLTVEAAVAGDGRILGVRVAMAMDQGAYPMLPMPSFIATNIVQVLFPGPYRIRDYAFECTITCSNKAGFVAYRGPWEVETWVRERLLDVVAAEVGLDPLEVRRRNLYGDDELPVRMATGPTIDHVSPRGSLERAAELIGYDAFRAEQAAARGAGRHLGIGLAVFVEPAPGPPDWGPSIGIPRPPQRALVRLEPDGTLIVVTSQSPHGQSHETTLAQVAADELGMPHERVLVRHGDTRLTPFAMVGTGGSRSATLATGAVAGATRALRDQVLALASALFEVGRDEIAIVDGRVVPPGSPDGGLALAELARMAWVAPATLPPGIPPGLEASHDYASPEGGWTLATHCCTVEVDPSTGFVRILRYLVVEDCGRIIHPAVVDGQIRGGVAQGIAAVLLERVAYDAAGQLTSTTFMDHLLPTASEVPAVEIEHQEASPLGIPRGVGEGGAIGAPAALTNAIEDALAPFGARVTEQHLPPTRVLELMGVI